MKRLILFFWLLLALSTIACCVLPAIGAKGFFHEFKAPYSLVMHAELLGYQLIGPLYTISLGSFLAFLMLRGKRVSGWLWALALIGPIYTVRAVGDASHDFSHVVFHQCSGIYGTWIFRFSVVSGVCLVALDALNIARRFRKDLTVAPPQLPM